MAMPDVLLKMRDIKVEVAKGSTTGAAPRPPYNPDGPPEFNKVTTEKLKLKSWTLAASAGVAAVAPALANAHRRASELGAIQARMTDKMEEIVLHAFLSPGAEVEEAEALVNEHRFRYDSSQLDSFKYFSGPPPLKAPRSQRDEEWQPGNVPEDKPARPAKPERRCAWDLLEI